MTQEQATRRNNRQVASPNSVNNRGASNTSVNPTAKEVPNKAAHLMLCDQLVETKVTEVLLKVFRKKGMGMQEYLKSPVWSARIDYFQEFMSNIQKHLEETPENRRTEPLLELYEFQTLTEYATNYLIFDPKNSYVCTPLSVVYDNYLQFFYEKRYKGEKSFQEFETLVKQKKTADFPGLTTKYQFARALVYVVFEKLHVEIQKTKTRILVLQGVGLKNPNTKDLKNVDYESWFLEQ